MHSIYRPNTTHRIQGKESVYYMITEDVQLSVRGSDTMYEKTTTVQHIRVDSTKQSMRQTSSHDSRAT